MNDASVTTGPRCSLAEAVRGRVVAFFEPDATWQRPLPPGAARRDLQLVVLYLALASLGLELTRSVDALPLTMPTLAQHALIWSAVAPLAVRRTYPVIAGLTGVVTFLAICMLSSILSIQWSLQAAAFACVFSLFAWASDRRAALIAGGAVIVMVFLWVGWSFALGSAIDEFAAARDGKANTGIIGPVLAYLLYTVILNLMYFVGAAMAGQMVWRSARQRAQLEEQNAQLSAQAQTIKEQAQVQERLRIARELHDVVAHHISVIGVQAAGARRVLRKDPERTSQALEVVEESSRRAVSEMRNLLGTLRTAQPGDGSGGDAGRGPDPSVRDIASLTTIDPELEVTYREIFDRDGAVEDIPPAIGLALYRTVQESLANIRRHSTARAADVALRTGGARDGSRYAEVEILDNGIPRSGTSGSGLGLLGVRERLSSLGGTSEIGPRPTGGYRVRVRFPIGRGAVTPAGHSPGLMTPASNAKTTA